MPRERNPIARLAAAAFLLAAMIHGAAAAPGPAECAPSDTAAAEVDSSAADSSASSPRENVNPRIRIILEDGGVIDIELFPDRAPRAVERILALVAEGYYDGLAFHRVESYLVQTGRGESGRPPIEGEMFGQRFDHDEGMVGMARLPDDYDSATTQFYIMKERRASLNGEYTIFGRVTEGMDVVRRIEKGNTIESVELLP